MKITYLIAGFLIVSKLFAQYPCKKVILKVCIDGETKLHIKNGILSWEHIRDDAPGTNIGCGWITKVNDKDWKDWKSTFKLDFNTDTLSMQPFILRKNEISKLVQSPSAMNGWETIWYFSDSSPLPHNYSMQFVFCPPGKTYDPKPKDIKLVLKKDSIKETKTKVANKVEYTEDIICRVYFETDKTIITKSSEKELGKLCDILKTNNLLIEISGYKKGNDGLKLYEERSLIIDDFLVHKTIDQKRIKYIGYGDSDKNKPSNKTIKCCIIIN